MIFLPVLIFLFPPHLAFSIIKKARGEKKKKLNMSTGKKYHT